jgi:hypothetical protein
VTYLAYALAFTAGVLLLLGVLLWMRKEKPTPAELERRRRRHVNRVGRITKGSILEIHDQNESGGICFSTITMSRGSSIRRRRTSASSGIGWISAGWRQGERRA